jgi:argininosuccinate synthase
MRIVLAYSGGLDTSVALHWLRERYQAEVLVFPALRVNTAYERRYLLAAPLSRPLIGKRLVEVARAEGADAVAHGSTGKGNDGVRFYAAVVAHDPSLQVLAPAAEWELTCRADELRYAEAHGIEVARADRGSRAPASGRRLAAHALG